MRFNSILISCFLFASAVLANARRPRRLNLPERSLDPTPVVSAYSARAGAIWTRNPGTFDFVHAIFAVPVVASVDGQDSSVDVLVMIGGDDCPNNITLALGLNFYTKPDGSTTDIQAITTVFLTDSGGRGNFLLYETLDIPISVQDVIELEIIALNATTGNVSINNLTKHRSALKEVGLSRPLCGNSVGWVVGDVSHGLKGYPLANFGTLSFTGASAGIRGSTSSYYQPYGATLVGNHAIDTDASKYVEKSAVIAYSDGPLWITYLN